MTEFFLGAVCIGTVFDERGARTALIVFLEKPLSVSQLKELLE